MAEGVQSAEQNTRRRFAAFMSYAHADAAIAAKLQSRLERYRLPKHLAQSHTGGEAALGQIFRDREDLAAAPSLSDAIRAAISGAEALVVICSPDAVASRWVGEEIALFRSLHPGRPILAAVVRGAPAEAFPAALTEGGNEPLAADLRKEADGPSLGFLKIVAGIAGVPLDALVQRDAQRRIRRVMWITGGALAAMLIMGIMTTLALSARNEAARQRASAEGLVEYMLTDLRDRLKGVGRLDVMEGVNERAMDYYAQQSVASLSTESIIRRGRIIEAMAADDEASNRFGSALAKYRTLHSDTALLLRENPLDSKRIVAHANSESRLGLLFFSHGDFEKSLPHFLQARAIVNSVEPSNRGNKEWMRLSSYIETNLCGSLLKNNNKKEIALEHCRDAAKKSKLYLDKHPSDNNAFYDHILDISWLAQAYAANGFKTEAVSHFNIALKLVNQLVAMDKKNLFWLEEKMQICLHVLKTKKQYNLNIETDSVLNDLIKTTTILKDSDAKNIYWKQKHQDALKMKKGE